LVIATSAKASRRRAAHGWKSRVNCTRGGDYPVFHKAVQAHGTCAAAAAFSFCAVKAPGGDVPARSPLNRFWGILRCSGPKQIEETSYMSMQSHLAELEKRHRMLEDEINEMLSHPAADDLQVLELKRRKLQVKDEIARLRQTESISLH
jgi:hypothetical protein